MLSEIFLAIIQAATEFLPISSSGHLALFSNLISEPNLFFFTALHIASLLAVLIFTRKEIYKIVSLDEKYLKITGYVIIATIPAVIVGWFFKDAIEQSLNSYFFLGGAFIFTGFILLGTKFTKPRSELNVKNSLLIGLIQALALFPGISRSGMAISGGLFTGIKKEEAVMFSFLLFIPLAIGAFILEFGDFYINASLIVSFIICFLLSYVFLNLLVSVVRKGYFWMFCWYCWAIGIVSLILAFLA